MSWGGLEFARQDCCKQRQTLFKFCTVAQISRKFTTKGIPAQIEMMQAL